MTTERAENGSRHLRDFVDSVLKSTDTATLRRVIGKSIAISSGKGGVGKTITSCNLAIYYARRGLRVGLVDLDPLSDVAALLDLQDSEQVFTGGARLSVRSGEGIAAYQMPVFKGLEILFPFQKLARGEAASMLEKLYRQHLDEIDNLYDLFIFDMPAGMSYDDNLVYLAFMNRLVLVTNPEPTAHASAGAYVKEVQRLYPGTRLYLWHNRYS
ncbi:MAG TPA: P-loop NTPase, partial [Spirochaetia bacterium]|nr:P-loop NTPase [Spirochaetia bacterium]